MATAPHHDQRLRAHESASDFFKVCLPFLCEREAENNLILGIGGILGTPSSPYDDYYLASFGTQQVEGAFMMTPPHKLIISSPASDNAILAVIDHVQSVGRVVPGINGRAEIADRFSRLWRERIGGAIDFSMALCCYRLSAVNELQRASGNMRSATTDDLDTMVIWAQGFDADAGVNHRECEQRIRQKLRNGLDEGHFFLWEDGKPVSMVRTSGTTPTGARISYVYTPPEYRGHGYASSLVADISALKLQEGKHFCYLFTDAGNATTNKIYRQVGYEVVCDFHEYQFS